MQDLLAASLLQSQQRRPRLNLSRSSPTHLDGRQHRVGSPGNTGLIQLPLQDRTCHGSRSLVDDLKSHVQAAAAHIARGACGSGGSNALPIVACCKGIQAVDLRIVSSGCSVCER